MHHGVTCDGCKMAPITGARYSCTTCMDKGLPYFDLCSTCHQAVADVAKERMHNKTDFYHLNKVTGEELVIRHVHAVQRLVRVDAPTAAPATAAPAAASVAPVPAPMAAAPPAGEPAAVAPLPLPAQLQPQPNAPAPAAVEIIDTDDEHADVSCIAAG